MIDDKSTRAKAPAGSLIDRLVTLENDPDVPAHARATIGEAVALLVSALTPVSDDGRRQKRAPADRLPMIENAPDDREDAALFRFWIEEAARRPSRAANALAGCTAPNDYRVALRALRGMADNGPVPIVPLSADRH